MEPTGCIKTKLLLIACVLIVVGLVATTPSRKGAQPSPELETLTFWQNALDKQHEFLERQLLHTHDLHEQQDIYRQLQNNVMMRNLVNKRLENLKP